MPPLPELDPHRAPLWMRLGRVAPVLGLSPDVVLSSIEAGQLPIRSQTFGHRGLVHLYGPDVLAYILTQRHASIT